jgi:hypothetical protein
VIDCPFWNLSVGGRFLVERVKYDYNLRRLD